MITCLEEARMLKNMYRTRFIYSSDKTFQKARNFSVSFHHCWTSANMWSQMTNDTFCCRQKVGALSGLTVARVNMRHKSSHC